MNLYFFNISNDSMDLYKFPIISNITVDLAYISYLTLALSSDIF